MVWCNRCGEISKRTPIGHTEICKKYRRDYYEKNKKKITEKHEDYFKAYQKLYSLRKKKKDPNYYNTTRKKKLEDKEKLFEKFLMGLVNKDLIKMRDKMIANKKYYEKKRKKKNE